LTVDGKPLEMHSSLTSVHVKHTRRPSCFDFCMSILPMLLLPRLPTVMMKFPFRVSPTVLLWFRVMVMLRFLSYAPVSRALPPPPPLLLCALNLPCSLAADALSGMVNSDLLLLLQFVLVLQRGLIRNRSAPVTAVPTLLSFQQRKGLNVPAHGMYSITSAAI
jgi:hypothetical protein